MTKEMEEALAERTAIMIVDGELSPEEARRRAGECMAREFGIRGQGELFEPEEMGRIVWE